MAAPRGLTAGNMARQEEGVVPEGRARGRVKDSTLATSQPRTGDATQPAAQVPVHCHACGPLPVGVPAAEPAEPGSVSVSVSTAHLWSAHAGWQGDWDGDGVTVGVGVSEGDSVGVGVLVGVSLAVSLTVGDGVPVRLMVGVRVGVTVGVTLAVPVMEMVGVREGVTLAVVDALSDSVGVIDGDRDELAVVDGDAWDKEAP